MRSRIRGRVVVATVAAVVVLAAAAAASSAPPAFVGPVGPEGGIVFAHGQGEASHRHSNSPNLIYHGGPVMRSGAAATAIFWGASWAGYRGDKLTGIDSFYSGVGGTSYAGTNAEYTDSSGAHVGVTVSYAGHLVDTSSAPSHAPQTSTIAAEVAKMIPNPVANGYYPVYVDTPRGNTRYCAWHSYGTVNGVNVQFAFFFNLDGDRGCDPGSSGSQSQGLAALGNVSGHELSEALTDPALNAWYDGTGEENADKCAWTFGSKLVSFKNGTSWKIQGNWSNSAYDSGRGYTDASQGVVRGCIDGTN